MYRKPSQRYRLIAAGGALAVAGAFIMSTVNGVGVVGLALGLFLVALGVVRGRRPVVTMEATRVLLRFAAPVAIPFHSIASVDLLQTNDLSLALQNGSHVLIPMATLEADDAAWLKKTLRREVRMAGRPLSA